MQKLKFEHKVLLLSGALIHHPVKLTSAEKIRNSDIEFLKKLLKIPAEEINYLLNLLISGECIKNVGGYLHINLSILNKFVEKEIKEKKSQITIKPDFEVIVPPDISGEILFNIIQIFEFKGRDVIYKFYITHNSLHNAILYGWKEKEIIDFLKSITVKVPDNIIQHIKEVFKRHGEIKIGNADLYLNADKHILLNLKRKKKFLNFVENIINEQIVILKEGVNYLDLFYFLKEEGFFPEIKFLNLKKSFSLYHLSLTPVQLIKLTGYLVFIKELCREYGLSFEEEPLDKFISEALDKMDDEKKRRVYELKEKILKQMEKIVTHKVQKSIEKLLGVDKPVNIKKELIINYKGENPAIEFDDIKKIVKYAIKNKLKLIIGIREENETREKIVSPVYLYEDIMYFPEKGKKTDLNLKKVKFALLIE